MQRTFSSALNSLISHFYDICFFFIYIFKAIIALKEAFQEVFLEHKMMQDLQFRIIALGGRKEYKDTKRKWVQKKFPLSLLKGDEIFTLTPKIIIW